MAVPHMGVGYASAFLSEVHSQIVQIHVKIIKGGILRLDPEFWRPVRAFLSNNGITMNFPGYAALNP